MTDFTGRFFTERGISPEVAQARGYVWCEPGDSAALKQAWPSHPIFPITATRNGGWLIPRYAPEGLELAPISAQFRPEAPVETDRYLHFHGDDPTGAVYPDFYPDDGPNNGQPHPKAGEPLPPGRVLTGHAKLEHIDSDHRGQNVENVHWKVQTAKYLYEPPPRIEVGQGWWHDHAECYAGRPDLLHQHLNRWHDGQNTVGRHRHSYTHKVNDTSNGAAKRIDVPPGLTRADFLDADRIFFVMEGCPKTDSIRSAGEVVCGVGSVTVWDAPELELFVQTYLEAAVEEGIPVYLVPDAEWCVNPMVGRQALLFRSRLRSLGVTNAQIAAPPPPEGGFPDGYLEAVRKGEIDKYDHNGVDDHLGAGGTVDDLLVFNRETPLGVRFWIKTQASGWSDRRVARAARALEGLALHAHSDGTFHGSLTTLGRVMDEDDRRIQRGLRDLNEIEAITADESLEDDNIAVAYTRGRLVPGRWFGRKLVRGLDWGVRPILTIRKELRALELPPTRLGDFKAEEYESVEDSRRSKQEHIEEFFHLMGELFDRRAATGRAVFHPSLVMARDLMIGYAHEHHGWGWREFERRLKGTKGLSRKIVDRVVKGVKEKMDTAQLNRMENKIDTLLFRDELRHAPPVVQLTTEPVKEREPEELETKKSTN